MIAASPALDPADLDLPDPGGDALLGLGRVAALTSGEFTHVVAGAGIEHWDADFWREDGDELEELDELHPGPLDLPCALELLADAPYGVREALLDAALDGPVVLVDPDPQRRAAWIAWISAILPEPPTFATFATRPLDVRVCATTHEHVGAFPAALDTTLPVNTEPSRYATIASTVAGRDPSALGELDPVALAVNGGATDLLTPEDLPRALRLITDLARRGEVAVAARAAAGLGAGAVALVVAETPRPAELELHVERKPEPPDAEVVEAEAVEIVDWPTVEAEPVEEPTPWAPPVVEQPVSLRDLEASLEPLKPEPEVVREDTFGAGLPLHELEEAVETQPAQSGRSLDELMTAFTTDPLEAPEKHEQEPEEVEETELGLSLSEVEATLEVTQEADVGMSLEEFEASLKRERES